jgi:hypothetical protein
MVIAEFDQFQKSLSAGDRAVLDELVLRVLQAAWRRRTDKASITAKDVVGWIERAGSAVSTTECEALAAYALAGGASLQTSAALQEAETDLQSSSRLTGNTESASLLERASGSSMVEGNNASQIQATQQMQELQTSFNLEYLQLQSSMQNENRQFKVVSNIMKTRHDTVKNSISNIH